MKIINYSTVELKYQDTLFDRFSTNRTIDEFVATQLTRSMSTEENHVLPTIQTHHAHNL